MEIATRDGDEVGICRSGITLTVCRATPSNHGAIGSEGDAVIPPGCDRDEVGIRRSVVALTVSRVTPSDHCTSGPTSRQEAKCGGVAFVERCYTTERVNCTRRESYVSSRSRERELNSARQPSCRCRFVPP